MSSSVRPLSVSQLNALLQEVIETNFVQIRVEGEISNFSAPTSGHFYFTLKDQGAQIRAVIFRSQNRLLTFRPENGMRVVLSGRATLYPQRGELQLVAESLAPAGVGDLRLAFEQLKARLGAEGLFATERKRSLPPFPAVIGIVTSPTGAAIHDILTVLRRRGAGVRVVLRPVRVQGEGAAAEIAAAIADLNRHAQADVLIVGRGGGSLEDLWAFNEEAVARAIVASQIPVIAAVGHEIDTSIADLAADWRAATPSAAAEIVVKNRLELATHLDQLTLRLGGRMQGVLRLSREVVAGLRGRLRSPRQQLLLMDQAATHLRRRLQSAMGHAIRQRQGHCESLAARLDTLSPLKTLARGYAIAFDAASGQAIRDAATLRPGQELHLRFARGSAQVTVHKVAAAEATEGEVEGENS